MQWMVSFILLFTSSAAFGSSISFEAKAHLPQNKALYLEDVAVLSTDDTGTLEALRSIKVADNAQEAERMTVQQLLRKIRPQIKVIERHCECKLQIHIPKEMSDYTLNGEFTTEKLLSKVESSIKEVCPSCEVEIKNSALLRGVLPQSYKYWSSITNGKELKGTSMVRVFFDDNALNPLVYQMFVSIKKPVLKVVQPLPAGTLPKETVFETVMMDVTYENRSLASVDDLVNTELRRSLGAGELLTLSDLILKYTVKIGETIKVVVNSSSLEMEMTGIAQKSGRVGDKIPVRLASTRKDMTGEILKDGRVAL